MLLATSVSTGLGPQLSQPLHALLPFIVLAQVAASICTGAFALQVPLLWWRRIVKPWVQQYPLAANFWATLDVLGRANRRDLQGKELLAFGHLRGVHRWK